ncbi:tryptophan--tRNA ligase, mitochondrial isoform X2 [Agrilus planipennis]|nr:tryptophan--tRNA ligase, mitochondrial isoform X2 [Agrilus planipennis]XP_018331296.1 tryptophan--tRNA ligase, mitochondrial isoform X2 [Agrilus planipennis]XP_018331297.1 tryptophan--tRNA ligase, mitochondrial isoform X2 [Agrilus planipennis]
MHLGNYFGAITQWIDLQHKNEDITVSVVDLHSITLPQDPNVLPKSILEMTATLLACGIDPNKSVIFQQSRVLQHTELFWYLGCICTMARLAHLPQYKEKSALLKDVLLGIFIYPVLQAADILVHKATHVPVGEDQIQQLQLCQELAQMFNKKFGTVFPIPRTLLSEKGSARIRSLREPSKKMSKSDPDSKSRICLTDASDDIVKKIKKAVTDFTSAVTYDPESRPGVSNLILIHSLISGKQPQVIVEESQYLDTLKYKHLVADVIIEHLLPIKKKIEAYIANPEYLDQVLREGSEKAQATAEETMVEVRRKVGINFLEKLKEESSFIVI